MKIFTFIILSTVLVIAHCKAFNVTDSTNILGKSFQGQKFKSMKAIVYLTSKLIFVGGGVLLTPIRVLTQYLPLQDYVKGTINIENLRVGVGRNEINADDFPFDHPAIKVIDDGEYAYDNLHTALVFISDITVTTPFQNLNVAFLKIEPYSSKLNLGITASTTFFHWNKKGFPEAYSLGIQTLKKKITSIHVPIPNVPKKTKYLENWLGGFLTHDGILIGIAADCRPDIGNSHLAYVYIIPVNGHIKSDHDVIIEK